MSCWSELLEAAQRAQRCCAEFGRIGARVSRTRAWVTRAIDMPFRLTPIALFESKLESRKLRMHRENFFHSQEAINSPNRAQLDHPKDSSKD